MGREATGLLRSPFIPLVPLHEFEEDSCLKWGASCWLLEVRAENLQSRTWNVNQAPQATLVLHLGQVFRTGKLHKVLDQRTLIFWSRPSHTHILHYPSLCGLNPGQECYQGPPCFVKSFPEVGSMSSQTEELPGALKMVLHGSKKALTSGCGCVCMQDFKRNKNQQHNLHFMQKQGLLKLENGTQRKVEIKVLQDIALHENARTLID